MKESLELRLLLLALTVAGGLWLASEAGQLLAEVSADLAGALGGGA